MLVTEKPIVSPRRLAWQVAVVHEVIEETPRVCTIVLDVPHWPGHLAGQHVDIRLTGEDGYQAQRSYSIASPPGDPYLKLTVERIAEGEVSPYLTEEVRAGDRFELRGPIGGYFVWTGASPLFLVAGGSGVAPLMSMLRHRASERAPHPATLLYSSRTLEEVIYRRELEQLAQRNDGLRVVHTLTRGRPPGWTGGTRRIDRAMLAELGPTPEAGTQAFICGPTGLVESAARSLVEIGHAPALIKTERFGPTGEVA
jgi:ferredoxin-NADP reductase